MMSVLLPVHPRGEPLNMVKLCGGWDGVERQCFQGMLVEVAAASAMRDRFSQYVQ
jgi:hypothetical protein